MKPLTIEISPRSYLCQVRQGEEPVYAHRFTVTCDALDNFTHVTLDLAGDTFDVRRINGYLVEDEAAGESLAARLPLLEAVRRAAADALRAGGGLQDVLNEFGAEPNGIAACAEHAEAHERALETLAAALQALDAPAQPMEAVSHQSK